VLRDQAVGVSVGFPAKLVTFGPPRTEGSTLFYHGGGEVFQSLAVHLGYPNCQSLDGAYQRTTARRPFAPARTTGSSPCSGAARPAPSSA